MKIAAVLLAAALLAGCATQFQVAEIDPNTRQLASKYETDKAAVLVAKKIDFKRYREFAYFSNGGEYGIEQLKATRIFDSVLDYSELQKLVIDQKLQEKVTTLREPLGLNQLCKAYKPFLWVYADNVLKNNKRYLRLVATDTETLEEVFVAEVYLDFVSVVFLGGVSDQSARYPLFNAFLDWSNQNL